MLDKLDPVIERYHEIEESMGDPDVAADFERIQALARERASLENLVNIGGEYKGLVNEIDDLEALLSDATEPELAEMARAELESSQAKLEDLTQALRLALLPKNPNDERDVIMEIRAGTGGAEAGIFASDLYRAYSRYAVNQGWNVEIMDSNPTEVGGFNKVVFEIQGKGVFSRMKFESGVHRVQRVPTTEANGRIHTSTATVAVLPEAEEVEVDIDPNDLEITVCRASGPGGQSVNTTDSAVRFTHLPSGIVVQCQNERSQHKNRSTAMKMLKARLYDLEQQELNKEKEILNNQKQEIAWGSQIRSYVLHPYQMVKDHRTDFQSNDAQAILDGDLDELLKSYLTSQMESASAPSNVIR